MATRKVKAEIVKAVDGNDLSKAGVDVKLSKMEIADYIAEKAKEELTNRLSVVQDTLNKYWRSSTVVAPTKLQQDTMDALTKLTGHKYATMVSWNIDYGQIERSEWRVTLVIAHEGGGYHGTSVHCPADASQIPDVDMIALHKEQNEINNRIHELGKKKHRTYLIEQILSANESGKKVLADLKGMVNRAVNG